MSRPAGVTVSAVFLILGSLLTLLVGLVAPFAHSLVPPEPPEPPFAQAMMAFMAVVFCVCAIWGLLTAVDLFRMRRWARISILVIGALLVIFCGLSLLMILVVPLLVPSLESTREVGMVMGIMISVYLVPIALGIGWLIYFSRAAVKAEFLQGVSAVEGPRRPLSIAVIAWHAIVFGLFTVPISLMHWPACLFGIVLTGWAATLIYLVFGAAELAIGVGLLKLKPWSHTAAVWFCIFVMALNVMSAFLPDKAARMNELMRDHPLEFQGDPALLMEFIYWFIVLITWPTFGMALWYLFTRKKAFLEAGKVAQATA